MAWYNPFLLGRPGLEVPFEVNPKAMHIQAQPVGVLQRNLSGDLKKSLMKTSAPVILINSDFLSLDQRNLLASLTEIDDTFLSFRVRDDLKSNQAKITLLSTTTGRLPNSSAVRLSEAYVAAGLASVLTILTPFYFLSAGGGFGDGGFGEGGFGGGAEEFDPGTVTYDDATHVLTWTNPIADLSQPVFVSYLYTGWLVNMEAFGHQAQGGWLDRFTYDVQLTGA